MLCHRHRSAGALMSPISKPRQTTRGLYGMPVLHGIVYRFTTFVITVLSRTIWRARLEGLDRVPKEEPFLLLPNHASMLDPFWVGVSR